MIIINDVFLPLSFDFSLLKKGICEKYRLDINGVDSVTLVKKSIDARKKNDIKFCVSVKVAFKEGVKPDLKKIKNASPYKEKTYVFPSPVKELRPVVVGFGPAGMFASYFLARAGLKPVIFERGEEIDERIKSVEKFFDGGSLNIDSNVQFGEGGAGTFSDGKLNTGIKDERCRTVLEIFNRFGADESILYDAKPHIGTDVLRKVVKNIRNDIVKQGGEIHFSSKVTDFETENGRIKSVILENGEKYDCDALILAIGHSARDTFFMLKEKGMEMRRKPFSVGVRIEHLQKDINTALYGSFASHPALPPASYKLSVRTSSDRGVYTFCMCPGGYVVNASSEEKRIAVNGMSNFARNSDNADSAVLVTVEPDDIKGNDVLEGIRFQREIEENAYNKAGGKVPVQTAGSFLYGKENRIGKVIPTVKPDYELCDISDIFPDFVTDSLKESLPLFDKKLSGFASDDALLTAAETRSSSPVRILRNENLEALSVKGLYPCGEGAGYAGGIMSAAVDGIKCAEKACLNKN